MNRRKLNIQIFFGAIVGLMFLAGCEKPEGYGGESSISGKIITQYYNDDYSSMIREAPAVDEEVFLLFGDSEFVGDKVETSSTGAFTFSYLRPGKYTVYFSSIDSSLSDEVEKVVSIDVDLKSGEEIDLDTLNKLEVLQFDEGSAKISGVIKLINYKNSSEYPFLEVKDTSFAQEQEVYLIYGNHTFYDERIRTSYDGYFEFKNLIPGEYEIFTYSEDLTGGTEDVVIKRNVTITGETEEIDLGIILIQQL